MCMVMLFAGTYKNILKNLSTAHNPEVVGSNPAPATRKRTTTIGGCSFYVMWPRLHGLRPGGDVCERCRWASRERCRWQNKRPKKLSRHLALYKQGAGQSLSANPEEEVSKKEWQTPAFAQTKCGANA